MDLSVFHTYDIRGIFNKELTPELFEKIGKAFGTITDSEQVVVGYDTRASSPEAFESFVKGVLSTGTDVMSVGMNCNPVTYFFGFKNKLPGALITASHNPPEYNGVKFFRKNGTSFIDELNKMKKIILEESYDEKPVGDLIEVDYAIQDYIEFIGGKLEIKPGLKMVADCFNASSATVTPFIFKNFEIDCLPINNEIKGDFGGLRPEPKGENLNTLKEKVVEEGADFGVAFDGDTDRAVFVDNKGRELKGAMAGAIFLKHALEKNKGVVVPTIDCPTITSKLVKENGGKTSWCRIGHGFIEENLVNKNGVFGFEQSCHFYFNDFYPFSDGLLSALKMAEILSKSNKSLSEMVDEIKMNPTEKLYIYAGNHTKKEKVMDAIRKDYPDGKDYVDGIKIFLNDEEWVLLRASQTNPEINLCVEAKNEERLKELIKDYTEKINKKIKEVE